MQNLWQKICRERKRFVQELSIFCQPNDRRKERFRKYKKLKKRLKMVVNRVRVFGKLKKITLKEYRSMKKEKLVNIIHSQSANYGKLRNICQNLHLENEFLKRKYVYKRRKRLR